MFEETSTDFSGMDRMAQMVDSIMLEKAIRQLPDDQQAILILVISGFKQLEIARLLGISRTTIWSKKAEALNHLRQILEEVTKIECRKDIINV